MNKNFSDLIKKYDSYYVGIKNNWEGYSYELGFIFLLNDIKTLKAENALCEENAKSEAKKRFQGLDKASQIVSTPDFAKKPPLGLIPSRFFEEELEKRIKDISDAIKRYIESKENIPIQWVMEYNKINHFLNFK